MNDTRPRGQAAAPAGFTVVEIAVVVPIVSIVILSVFAIILTLLQSSAAERVGAQNLYDIHAALSTIEEDAALTNSFLTSPDTGLTDANAPSNGWLLTGDDKNHRVLLLRSYATTTNPRSGTRQPVFYTTNGCDPATLYSNNPMTYDTLYFVKDKTLYRRRLVTVDPSKPTCSPPYQKQSCPATLNCGTADEIIASDVSQFSVDYYPSSANDTASDVYSSTANYDLATSSNSAGVTLGLTRRAYGQPLTTTLTLRISKLITGKTND